MQANKVLRIVVSAVLLAASAAASIMPDWATVLKAQSYYGNVDLRLSAQAESSGIRAGGTSDLLVTVGNNGPDDAHGTRTRAVVQGNVLATATNGCNEDPLAYPLCTLSAPLPAGGTADFLMRLAVPPDARGHITVALAADSWDFETAPGQELILLELPIEAHVDLRASALCDHTWLKPGVSLSCQVVLYNAGPATALSPRFEFDSDGADVFDFSCSGSRTDLCPRTLPATWRAQIIAPGDVAVLWFQIDPARGAETLSLHAAVLGIETEDRPADNRAEQTVPVPLFRDDFEGTPPNKP